LYGSADKDYQIDTIRKALLITSRDEGNGRGDIYSSTVSVMFFGTPNAGSTMDKKKRIQILKPIGKVAFIEVPPKIEDALTSHSDELLDLADDFRRIDICKSSRLLIYSFFEAHDTPYLGERVHPVLFMTIVVDRLEC